MVDKYERLLDFLAQSDDRVTATELAEQLGVTTRTVRSYVTAAKSAAQPLNIISSSTTGYRLNREAYATFSTGGDRREADGDTPRDRVHHLVRRLTESPDGLDIYDLANSLYVSESTIESDLRKVRSLSEEAGLALSRHGTVVALNGTEAGYRRVLSDLFRSEGAQGFLELERVQREFTSEDLGTFKTGLIAMLVAQGYFVNEYGINSVLLHVAIAVDRVIRRKDMPTDQPATDATALPASPMAVALHALTAEHFGVDLDPSDLEHLAALVSTRVITPGQNETVAAVVENHVVPEHLETVRRIVAQVSDEYLLDLDDETFMVR
ncbi:MAG: hypothetical protein JWM51_1001, partial [Microbacteriaceae bacterium]|nr:hypothetical protein [Microbacteriaceae bacterium]